MPQTHTSPVDALRDGYHAESYWPGDYLTGAALHLNTLGILNRPITDHDRTVTETTLTGLRDTDLDVTDVFPFGTVWALLSTGALRGGPDLDTQLADWRRWEETDHYGEPLTFLPSLPPVLLLDVDGVVNASTPGWSAPPRKGYASDSTREYALRWAPALIDRIRSLHKSGLVEVRWCTTWCAYADQLERLWALPTLGRAFTDDINGHTAALAKLTAARHVLTAGRRLIWADDSEVPLYGEVHDELIEGGRALLIRPKASTGLQPEHLDQIEVFARKATSDG
ncbi:hypothetical protein ABZY58_11065 [Micromonospora tulbaghiae]|uniref:hypothetical protein n=1 Tax=Micromonospora tulbaghiae TaxID=479978 RepID=UPI0033B5FFD4